MVPVPTHQVLDFLSWIHRRGVRLGRGADLHELAREYLRTERPSGSATSNLRFLVEVFQQCERIREATAEAQMAHFSGCGQCSDIRQGRDPGNSNVVVWSSTLHPFLERFLAFAKDSQPGPELGALVRVPVEGRDRSLRELISAYGAWLRRVFSDFLRIERQLRPHDVEEFEEWRRRRARGGRQDAHPSRQLPVEQGTAVLGDNNEDREWSARRLSETAAQAIRGGYYDDYIAANHSLCRMLDLVAETPGHQAQALEFLAWLRKRDASLDPPRIPSDELNGLVDTFCEEVGYSNAPSFRTEIGSWLRGVGPPSLLERLARFLKLKGSRAGQDDVVNPYDRYGRVGFHGLFLFLSSGDFPAFIKTHWRDLHHLSGDALDIYYTQRDLEDRTSGYEISKELRSVDVPVTSLPALLVWPNTLHDARLVPLGQLTGEEIVGVVQVLVESINRKTGFCGSVDAAGRKADEVRMSKRSVTTNNVTVHGGQVGAIAVGDGATAHGSVEMVAARATLVETALSPEHEAILRRLAETLAATTVDGVDIGDRLDGARHLATLAGGDADAKVTALAGWRGWVDRLGARAGSVLGVLANVVTVAGPLAPVIAKLLGVPLPM